MNGGKTGSIVINIEAEITGYQEQLKEIQAAFNKLDPGSSLAKSIGKALITTSKQVEGFSRNLTQTISSQEGLDKLTKNLQTVAFNIREMAMEISNASWKDLAEGPASELRKLNLELNEVRNKTASLKIDAFNELLKDAPKLKELFEELKIDPKKMNVDQIEGSFERASKSVEKAIDEINGKIEESQKKIDGYNQAIAMGKNLPDYARYTSSNLRIMAEQNKATTKLKTTSASVFEPKNSIEFQKTFSDLESKILGNLGRGLREGNESLIDKVKTDLQKPLQELQTAITEEAIKSALSDIDKILATGTPTGLRGGVQLKGTTGKGVKEWVSELVGAGTFTPQVSLDAFKNTIDTYTRMAEELKTRGADTSVIENFIKNLFPTQSIGEIKASFNSISDEIAKGYQTIIKTLEEAKKRFNSEQANKEGLETILQGLIIKKENISEAQNLITPVIAQLNNKIKEANEVEARLRKAIEETTARGEAMTEERPFAALGEEQIEKSNVAISNATRLAELYGKKLNEIKTAQEGLNNLGSFIKRWFSVYAAINMVRNAFNSIKNTIKELDDIMTQIAIVTNMTQQDLWNQMSSYAAMAKEYAVSIKGVYEVSQLFYQQGLQQAEVMALTEQTLKMARISGLNYATATDYMTNAIRSFKMEISDAQRVVDVYSVIAAKSATDTAELANAMSKTASSAEAVGSSFENTTAMMAVMINISVPYAA